MSALDPSLEEAARIDGAGLLGVLWHIVVPNLRRVLEIVLVINTITAFAFMFAYIYTITNGGPGLRHVRLRVLHLHPGLHEPEPRLRLGARHDADRARAGDRDLPDPAADEAEAMSAYRRSRARGAGRSAARGVRAAGRSSAASPASRLSALFPLAFMAVTAFRTEKDWDANKLGLPTTFSFGVLRARVVGSDDLHLLPQLADRHARHGGADGPLRDARRLLVLEAPLARLAHPPTSSCSPGSRSRPCS